MSDGRDARVETYYSGWGARDMAEKLVELEDEGAAAVRVDDDRIAALNARDAEIVELKKELARVTRDLRVSQAKVDGAALHVERTNARVAMLEAALTTLDGFVEERDRCRLAWQSARRRAKTAVGAWRYTQWRVDQHDEARRSDAEFQRCLWGQLTERSQERNRYRSAWLSARRRAAHESVMATAAVEHLTAERNLWRQRYERLRDEGSQVD
ncbi:hypothetical protein ACFWFX_18630 [Streptomyces roseolus]|uniref:hypothetical protein n=1 Tax=Streptomyces roseolus TaxID=67358 RepID=UPI003656B45A